MAKQRDSVEDEISRRVGRHMRDLREYLGQNREHIADQLGCTERSVKAYEEGTRRLTLADAVRLSEHFGVSLSRLVYGHDGPPRLMPKARFDEIGRPEAPKGKPPLKVIPRAGD